MIPLNRLKHADTLYLNPDHIEWMEQHADATLIRLSNGREYVVMDTVHDIVEAVRAERAQLFATGLRMAFPEGLVTEGGEG